MEVLDPAVEIPLMIDESVTFFMEQIKKFLELKLKHPEHPHISIIDGTLRNAIDGLNQSLLTACNLK